MASFLDVCRFSPTAGGTTDWTFSSAVTGYQSPSAASVVNGALYRYRAESADLTQWEIGYGTYNTSTGVLARTTILFNSSGTTSKINFTATPQVAVVALAEDIGGWTNRRLAKTAAYTVTQADAGMTIALSGAAYYPITFPAASGFDANHVNMLVNEDTGRGKLILPVYTTSSTSITIGTGSKAFTVASGLFFPLGRVRVYSLANPANFMAGGASYSGTTLTLTVDFTGGSGTFTDWQIATETILWPRQNVKIFNNANVWTLNPSAQLWQPDSPPTINVDPTGNDSNDGLGTTTSAVKTLGRAAFIAYSLIYLRNLGTMAIDGGGNTFQELVVLNYQLPGAGLIQFQNLTWKPANSGYALQLGDNSMTMIGGTTVFSSAGVTSPVGFVFMHQWSVLDLNGSNISVTPTVALSGDFITGDSGYRINVNGGLTVNAGTIGGFLYNGAEGSSWNINGTHAFNGTPTINRFVWSRACARMTFQGNVSFSGAITASASLVNQNGVLINLSGATLPGGTPTPTTGGQYNTTVTA